MKLRQTVKKLIGAYGNKSPICDIRLLDEDKDVVLMSDNNRVLLVNTEKIPLKSDKEYTGYTGNNVA